MASFKRPMNFRPAGKVGAWYEVKNLSADIADLFIYDEIGSWGVTSSQFIKDLGDVKAKNLNIRISSPGGDVFEGLAILNALRQHPAHKTVTVDGMAASAASFIAMAGDTIRMSPQSMMMVHDANAAAQGDARDMRALADLLDKTSDNIAAIYAQRTGRPADEWRQVMLEETWFTDQEAVDAGLADEITPAKKIKNLAGDREIGDGWVMGADGKPRFDPDGDGDDDSTPEGDTDHDYFDADGKQIKPIPPCPEGYMTAKKTKKVKNADVDNTPWDAAKAWHNGSVSDDPAAFYKGICAGEKSTGDPATQAHWALPYRYTPSSPPNAAGVRNALARLSQTQDLVNADKAKKTLEKAMKKINPDYDAGNTMDAGLLTAALRVALEGGM